MVTIRTATGLFVGAALLTCTATLHTTAPRVPIHIVGDPTYETPDGPARPYRVELADATQPTTTAPMADGTTREPTVADPWQHPATTNNPDLSAQGTDDVRWLRRNIIKLDAIGVAANVAVWTAVATTSPPTSEPQVTASETETAEPEEPEVRDEPAPAPTPKPQPVAKPTPTPEPEPEPEPQVEPEPDPEPDPEPSPSPRADDNRAKPKPKKPKADRPTPPAAVTPPGLGGTPPGLQRPDPEPEPEEEPDVEEPEPELDEADDQEDTQ